MKANNPFILIILAINSLLLSFSCNKEIDNTVDFYLMLTKKKGSNYLYNLSFNKHMNLLAKDSTELAIQECDKSSNLEDDIINGKLVNSCGVYNISKKSKTDFSKLILIKHIKNLLYLYDPDNRKITEYNLDTNSFMPDKGAKDFDLQIINNKIAFDYISVDLKNIVVLKAIDNDFYDLYLKNLYTSEERKIVKNIEGNNIVKNSNAKSVPSILWLSPTEFIYTNYINNGALSKCIIKKFNTLTQKNLIIGSIDNIKISSVNNKFIKDVNGGVYLKVENIFFKINNKNEKLSESDFNLGNYFTLSNSDNFFQINYKGSKIGDIPKNSSFEINKRCVRTIDGKIVLLYKKRIDGINPEWKNICLIWSAENKKWIEVQANDLFEIVSFTAS